MPALKQVRCYIQKGSQHLPLSEYNHIYGDGYVRTHLRVPREGGSFSVHLISDEFISSGLAMFVFVDGKYQCNRHIVGLKPREGKDPYNELPNPSAVDFLVRQEEVKSATGKEKFDGRSWDFEKIEDNEQFKSSGNVDSNTGTIEVVVLRCEIDPEEQARSYYPPQTRRFPQAASTAPAPNKPWEQRGRSPSRVDDRISATQFETPKLSTDNNTSKKKKSVSFGKDDKNNKEGNVEKADRDETMFGVMFDGANDRVRVYRRPFALDGAGWDIEPQNNMSWGNNAGMTNGGDTSGWTTGVQDGWGEKPDEKHKHHDHDHNKHRGRRHAKEEYDRASHSSSDSSSTAQDPRHHAPQWVMPPMQAPMQTPMPMYYQQPFPMFPAPGHMPMYGTQPQADSKSHKKHRKSHRHKQHRRRVRDDEPRWENDDGGKSDKKEDDHNDWHVSDSKESFNDFQESPHNIHNDWSGYKAPEAAGGGWDDNQGQDNNNQSQDVWDNPGANNGGKSQEWGNQLFDAQANQDNSPSANTEQAEMQGTWNNEPTQDTAKTANQSRKRSSKPKEPITSMHATPWMKPYFLHWDEQHDLANTAASTNAPEHLSHCVKWQSVFPYMHAVHRPRYIDSMSNPYALFVFKYRSQAALGKIFGNKLRREKLGSATHKRMLMKLSKHHIYDELCRVKRLNGYNSDSTVRESDESEGDGGNQTSWTSSGGNNWTNKAGSGGAGGATNSNADGWQTSGDNWDTSGAGSWG